MESLFPPHPTCCQILLDCFFTVQEHEQQPTYSRVYREQQLYQPHSIAEFVSRMLQRTCSHGARHFTSLSVHTYIFCLSCKSVMIRRVTLVTIVLQGSQLQPADISPARHLWQPLITAEPVSTLRLGPALTHYPEIYATTGCHFSRSTFLIASHHYSSCELIRT